MPRMGDRRRSDMEGCNHRQNEFLTRRDGVDYLHCLDCGQVFEADDLEWVRLYEGVTRDGENKNDALE